MVCIHCGQKTQVINSRRQQRTNQVWRRRKCLGCGAVFTTLEGADYSAAWLVTGRAGKLEPFIRDKLFLSLHRSLQHRSNALSDATGLTDTVTKKLLASVADGIIGGQTIVHTTQVALNRFDMAASVHYQAFHKG